MPGTEVRSVLDMAIYYATYLEEINTEVSRQVSTVLDITTLNDIGNAVQTTVGKQAPAAALKASR